MTSSVTAVIQARASSSRLPGKVLRPLGGRPVLAWVIRAAQLAAEVDRVVVATSTNADDDPVAELAVRFGAQLHRGPLDDVLARFVGAIDDTDAEGVVRLTADCPLLDPRVIDATVAGWRSSGVDYASTVGPRSLPRGLDVEVVRRSTLEALDRCAHGVHRVHVTSWLHHAAHDHTMLALVYSPAADDLRVTLDTTEDAAMLDALVERIGDRAPSWREVVQLCRSEPALARMNAHVRQKAVDEG